MKFVVVEDVKTKELVPFTLAQNGEVIITSSGHIIDNLIVKLIDSSEKEPLWIEENQEYYVCMRNSE